MKERLAADAALDAMTLDNHTSVPTTPSGGGPFGASVLVDGRLLGVVRRAGSGRIGGGSARPANVGGCPACCAG
jgi:hypothetical protein